MSGAKSFDTRIVFLCVINQTENLEVLKSFLTSGGWICLAKWLTIFMKQQQIAGIREVLKTLQKLPVTLDTLKMSVESKEEDLEIQLPGKMIRSLRKHEDLDIKKLSGDIYKVWNDLLKAENDKKAKKDAEKKKLKKEKAAKEKAKQGPQCTY